MSEDKIKAVKQLQREVDLSSELPPRDTGRKTGTAKTPTGPRDRLTEEERRRRHKQMVERGRTK